MSTQTERGGETVRAKTVPARPEPARSVPGKPVPPTAVTVLPVWGLPELLPGDDLAALLLDALRTQGVLPQTSDVLVVAQKAVSKVEGSRVALSAVRPSRQSLAWAAQWDKDARQVELVLREARRIVRMERGLIIAETRHGFVCANAGLDLSNTGTDSEVAILLPEDPDRSAALLREAILSATGAALGVIVSDSFGRPWRTGLTQVALGVAGLQPLLDHREQQDADGRPLLATEIALADELACAADLVCGKTARVPAALIRGVALPPAPLGNAGTGQALLREAAMDLFR